MAKNTFFKTFDILCKIQKGTSVKIYLLSVNVKKAPEKYTKTPMVIQNIGDLSMKISSSNLKN
tara:strand:- start:56 stop:244 length:189 start_codon:yes stop_codon:yes gene_type:complete